MVNKPWGYYKVLFQTPNIWVKEIFIKGGHKTSLQSHKDRIEFWYYVEGDGYYLRDDVGKVETDTSGIAVFIPQDRKHRLYGGKNGLKIIEVATGKPKEEDIIRYEDDYGR